MPREEPAYMSMGTLCCVVSYESGFASRVKLSLLLLNRVGVKVWLSE